MLKSEKGVSEIIVVILIVLVTVILTTIFLAWFRESSQNKLDDTSKLLTQASDLSCLDASFIIESCTLKEDGNVSILFSNNSDIRLFNLVLTVIGKSNDDSDVMISGRFNDLVNPGEIKYLNTGLNFVFISGDQETLSDISVINNTVLTNGACPKRIINIDCDVE